MGSDSAFGEPSFSDPADEIATLREKLAASESARREAEEKMEMVRRELAAETEAHAMTKRDRDSHVQGYASERAAREAAETRVAELERHRTKLDCRFVGRYAETSGSHCPDGEPCQRCELERARERAERELASITTDRDSWAEQADQRAAEAVEYLRRATAAESAIARATTALRGAEAHHDEQARLWADNEGDGEADLNAQYHSERRDVFTAVLAEVARG